MPGENLKNRFIEFIKDGNETNIALILSSHPDFASLPEFIALNEEVRDSIFSKISSFDLVKETDGFLFQPTGTLGGGTKPKFDDGNETEGFGGKVIDFRNLS